MFVKAVNKMSQDKSLNWLLVHLQQHLNQGSRQDYEVKTHRDSIWGGSAESLWPSDLPAAP